MVTWPNSTIVCVAPGPSLTREDVALACASARTIAINDVVEIAPNADVLYTSDLPWLKKHHGLPFAGLKVTMESLPGRRHDRPYDGWTLLRNTGKSGLETDPSGLRTGRNSGYAAINLAVHLGASRIVLIGYDMSVGPKGEARFNCRSNPSAGYLAFRREFDALVEPLRACGVSIVNASRRTALKCFERVSLEAALCQPMAVPA